MRELRLVPAATVTWLAVLVTLMSRQPLWGMAIVAVTALAAFWFLGEAVTAASLAGTAVCLAWLRMKSVPKELAAQFLAKVVATPIQTRTGGWSMQLEVGGTSLRAFTQQQPPPRGATILVTGEEQKHDDPEIASYHVRVSRARIVEEPQGFTAWSNDLKDRFLDTCARWLGPKTEGLVPGMVLGDTRAQSDTEKQMYLDTGLAHLSAVSGANITIMTATAVLLVKACTLGPRAQVAGAALTLGVFVAIVGFEPSVLRASVMGIVGLLAVLGSAQAEPAHGLCLAVIALLIYDSNLATSFGFALSVAATAGLIALAPLIYRAIARFPGPELLKRALAVAIAADLATMPLVAAMSGKVLTASVPANVAAAPAVAPVTILGLIGIAFPPALKLAEPFAWWIATVAHTFSSAPDLAIPTTWALLIAGWLLFLIHIKKAHWLLLGLILLIPKREADTVPLRNVIHVQDLPDEFEAPPGVDAVLVDKPGRPSKRPHRTPAGVPILYPQRDGPVRVLVDGTQRAERGHF